MDVVHEGLSADAAEEILDRLIERRAQEHSRLVEEHRAKALQLIDEGGG
jgi:hypothetical protein